MATDQSHQRSRKRVGLSNHAPSRETPYVAIIEGTLKA